MSTATNQRARRTELTRIRKVLSANLLALSTVICNDKIGGRADGSAGEVVLLPDGVLPENVIIKDELGDASDLLVRAINCVRRELGRKDPEVKK